MSAEDAGNPTVVAATVGSPGPRELLRRSLELLRPYWLECVAIGVASLIHVAFIVVFPLGVKDLLDHAATSRDSRSIVFELAGLGALFAIMAVADVGRDYLSAQVGAKLLNDLRRQMFRHLQSLSLAFFTRAETADLVARFANDLTAIDVALTRALPQLFRTGVQIAACVVFLFVLDWRLATVTLLALALVAAGPRMLGARAIEASYLRRRDEAQITGLAQENVAGQRIVRAFGLQHSAIGRFEQELARLERSSLGEGVVSRLVSRTAELGASAGQLLVIGAGVFLVLGGQLTVGALVGFVGLLLSAGIAVTDFSHHLSDWLRASGSLRRIDDLLEESAEIVDAPEAVALPRFGGEIRFDRVSFGYHGGARTLDGVCFGIQAGQSVAFVGRSGAGKSTVLDLLLRFYDPEEGTVTVDGHDLRTVTQESLRAQIGAVFQDTFLFNTTIRENIRLGRLEATDADVETAAKDAQVHDFITSLPGGYDTVVGERGGRLSGGQRQRLALARAILPQPAILVLDEATSALDARTEAAFNETLAALRGDRTVIAVTHRLTSVVDADTIFVLDHGRVVEQGCHAELLARRGEYARLWLQQLDSTAIDSGVDAAIAASRLDTIPSHD